MSQRHPVQNDLIMMVTTNIRDRRRLFIDPAYAREAIDALYRVQELYPFFLYAFVVMPDHVHLLLKVLAPGHISSVVRSYKRAVSHAIGKGPIWQPRFHVRLADSSEVVRTYIHLNPVRAGLVESSMDYPWSSASGKWDIEALEGF